MGEQDLPSPNDLPMFFNLLSAEDKRTYADLRTELWSLENKFKRNKRLSSLQKSIDKIHEFCIKHNSDDWKRCIVCGIAWLDEDIAINIRQLKLLVNKCKSSINGALLKMGYESSTSKNDGFKKLLEYIPYLRGNFNEQRMWTIRRKAMFTPAPQRFDIPQYFMDSTFSQTPQPLLQLFGINTYDKAQELVQIFGSNTCSSQVDSRSTTPPNAVEVKTEAGACKVLEDCCCCCPNFNMDGTEQDELNLDEEFADFTAFE